MYRIIEITACSKVERLYTAGTEARLPFAFKSGQYLHVKNLGNHWASSLWPWNRLLQRILETVLTKWKFSGRHRPDCLAKSQNAAQDLQHQRLLWEHISTTNIDATAQIPASFKVATASIEAALRSKRKTTSRSTSLRIVASTGRFKWTQE